MNNEPVAWLARNQLVKKYIPISLEEKEKFLPHVLQLYDDWIPLYTHPTKTLTDNEIIEIWSGMETDTGEQNIAFARAILRKAQEK